MLSVDTNYYNKTDNFNKYSTIRQTFLPPLAAKTTENINDILKDVDCIQETKEHKATIEYNWQISDIFDEIKQKCIGEKIQSDLFYFNKQQNFECKTSSGRNSRNLRKKPQTNSPAIARPIATSSPCRTSHNSQAHETVKLLDLLQINSSKLVRNDLVCDYFATNSKWNLQIQAKNNSDYLSIYTQLLDIHDLDVNLKKYFDIDITLKITFYILNSNLDEIYAKHTYEKIINLKDLVKCVQLHRMNSTNVKKQFQFGIEKFCHLNDLLKWFESKTTKDFCILSDMKLYENVNDYNGLDSLVKSTQKILKKSFKHIWTVKNWKSFYRGVDGGDFSLESKEFYLRSPVSNSTTFTSSSSSSSAFCDSSASSSDTSQVKLKIENILKQLKWKLDLYPNGYNQESNGNLSLFLNLSKIDDELKTHLQSGSIDLTQKTQNTNDSVNMKLFQNQTGIKAAFQISIIDRFGKSIDTCKSAKMSFQLNGCWGYKDYLKIKDLKVLKEKYKTDDLMLKCVITVYYTLNISSCFKFEQKVNLNQIKNPPPQPLPRLETSKQKASICTPHCLNQDLRRLYKRSDLYDLIIQAPIELKDDTSYETNGKVQFKAHKLILSMRSSVFDRMFSDQSTSQYYQRSYSSTNSNCEVLDIVDFDAHTIDLFLKYLYSDVLELDVDDYKKADEELLLVTSTDDDDAFGETSTCSTECKRRINKKSEAYAHQLIELIKISEKYCVFQLKQICELKLIELVNCKNLIQILIISHLYNSALLKKKCFKYLIENLKCLIKQKKWFYLNKNYSNLVNEAYRSAYMCQES